MRPDIYVTSVHSMYYMPHAAAMLVFRYICTIGILLLLQLLMLHY